MNNSIKRYHKRLRLTRRQNHKTWLSIAVLQGKKRRENLLSMLRNNNIRSERVSETNLMKTRDLLGKEAYSRYFARNISKLPDGDYPAKVKKFKLPE